MSNTLATYKAPLTTVLRESNNRDRFSIALNASLVVLYTGLALSGSLVFWLPAAAWLAVSWFNISVMKQQYELSSALEQLKSSTPVATSDTPQFRILK